MFRLIFPEYSVNMLHRLVSVLTGNAKLDAKFKPLKVAAIGLFMALF